MSSVPAEPGSQGRAEAGQPGVLAGGVSSGRDVLQRVELVVDGQFHLPDTVQAVQAHHVQGAFSPERPLGNLHPQVRRLLAEGENRERCRVNPADEAGALQYVGVVGATGTQPVLVVIAPAQALGQAEKGRLLVLRHIPGVEDAHGLAQEGGFTGRGGKIRHSEDTKKHEYLGTIADRLAVAPAAAGTLHWRG
mgnify:CR=1 FL=1